MGQLYFSCLQSELFSYGLTFKREEENNERSKDTTVSGWPYSA